MAEHIDRYDGVAGALTDAGYAVVGHNHLGHGEGTGLKGYFADHDGWQALINDVHRLREQIQQEMPGLPYFVLGHSMGSFVVRCYLTEHAKGLAGAIISGTGYYTPAIVAAGLSLARFECLIGKAKKEAPLIDKIAFSGNNKAFQPSRTPFDWLTRCEDEVDRYVNDPYCGFLFTGAGYRDMFRGLKRLTKTDELKKIGSDLPVLFLSGANDPVGNMGQGVRAVAEDYKAAGIKDVTVLLYPEGRHEMFNEINRNEVYRDLADWISRKI